MTHWWQAPFRVFQTNIREIDAVMDVEQVLDDLQAFHANAWLLNTGGIVSFYPSRLAYQHPSAWLAQRPSGDLIGDAVAAAHRRGVRVISRFDWSKLPQETYEQHPEWFFVGPDGQPQVYNGLYSACPSGPYNQELSFEVMGEALEQYAIDGIFFNMFGFAPTDYSGVYHGVCQCVNCQRRFREQYGQALPREADWNNPAWVDYLTFTRETAHELSARMREFIHAKRPEVALVLFMNAGRGDVVLHEINNSIQRPLPYWAHNTGEKIKVSQGEYPGAPVTINSVLFLDIPYRFAAEQPGYVGLRLAQMLAHGANPYVYVIGTTQQPDRRNHAIIQEMYAYHEQNAEVCADLRPVGRVALVQPRRSEQMYGQGQGFEGVTAAFRGFYRALTESHLPFEVLFETSLPEKAADGQLGRYEVLILPNAACLSEEEGQVIDDFACGGGRVIATFETGLYDARGQRRNAPLLECLGMARVNQRREEMRSAVLRIGEDARASLPGLAEMDLLAVLGAFLYVDQRADSQGALPLIPPMRYGPPEKCYWEIETEMPGLIWQDYGEGQTVYLPWQPDRYFYTLSLPEYRELLGGLARSMCAQPVVLETNAGAMVEVVVRDQPGGKRMVHLVNYSGQNGRSFNDPVEMRDVTVKVAVERLVKRVRATWLGQDLEYETQEGAVTFRLPSLKLFEKVVLE